jgi:phosphoesterase RecJ-like protein
VTDLEQLVSHIQRGQRFLLSSHQRPDGDAIGSAVGLALALHALGKQAQVVMDARPPDYLQPFPAVDDIRITRHVDESVDGALIMECSSLDRTGVTGLDRSPVLNIDHHVGNRRYGTVNWLDESAAACTEMVFTLIDALQAPLTKDIATHIYLGLLTDTGSFHFSHITSRSFEIARRCVDAGVDPQWVARTHYDSATLGRVRIFGQVVNTMQLDDSGKVALLTVTHESLARAGAALDDTEGIINFPLQVKDIQAVAFFKQADGSQWRVSLRSKGAVDVGAIARSFGGGGHNNAAGCTVSGELEPLQRQFMALLLNAVTHPSTR